MHLVRNGQCQVQYASTYSIIIFLSGLFICRNCRIPARYIYDTSCNQLLIEVFIKMICVGQNLANVCNR